MRERAGLLEEQPYRRGYRVGILEHAVEPLKRTLGPKGTERLIMALAMVYGIELYVIWKDIFGANDRKVETVARWMAQALVDAALRESRGLNLSAKTRGPNLNADTQRPQRKAEKAGSNGARATRSR